MILIVGRAGCGKDYVADVLKRGGAKVLKSYTTRPKRSINEDTHIFIDPRRALGYTDKVATVVINDAEYFATAQQVRENDVYIVDPSNAVALPEKMPDERFQIWYIKARDGARREHALSRACSAIAEAPVFAKREASEAHLFDEWDELLAHGTLPQNVDGVVIIQNDYSDRMEQKIQSFAEAVLK